MIWQQQWMAVCDSPMLHAAVAKEHATARQWLNCMHEQGSLSTQLQTAHMPVSMESAASALLQSTDCVERHERVGKCSSLALQRSKLLLPLSGTRLHPSINVRSEP